MVLGGDELYRTQRGNNNAYCQDNDTSWVDWGLRERERDLFRFVSRLLRFRQEHPSLRRRTFFEDDPTGPTVVWHGVKAGKPDWGVDSHCLAMHLLARDGDDDIYVAANAHWEAQPFELPSLRPGTSWRRFVDTTREPPDDVTEPGSEAALPTQKTYLVGPRSTLILVGR
jgi:glycogen operon protein